MAHHRSQPAPPDTAGPDTAGAPAAEFALPADAVVRRTPDGWRVGGEEVPDLTCAMVLADLLAAELPGSVAAAVTSPAPPPDALQPDPAASDPARTGTQPGSTTGPGSTVQSGSTGQSGSVQAGSSGAGVPVSESAATPTPSASGPETASAVASEARRLKATVSQLQYALTARIRVEQAIGVLAERHRIQPRQAFEQLRAAARSRGRKVIDIATDVVASATNPLLQLPDELSRPRSAGRRTGREPRGAI